VLGLLPATGLAEKHFMVIPHARKFAKSCIVLLLGLETKPNHPALADGNLFSATFI
jgi:hypothetical protein